MKKTLLTFVAFFAMMSMALAQTLTWTSADWTGVAENAKVISCKIGDFTLTADKIKGQSNPTVNATTNDLRVYAGGALTVAATKNVQKLVFNVSKKGQARLAEITANVGAVAIDKAAWTVTWTGDANSVVFTVGPKAVHGTDGATKAGQFCIDNIVVGDGGGDVKPEPQPEPSEEVAFSADFAKDMCGFTIDNKSLSEGLTEVWSYNAKYKSMKATASVGKDHVPHASEAWAVSPVIDLTKVKNATLTFINKANFFGDEAGFKKACSVKVKAEGETAWKDVVVEGGASGMNWDEVTSTADLKAFDGKKIQIAFAYTSTTTVAGTWEFVNVKVASKGGDVNPEPQPEETVYTTIADLKKNATKDAVAVSFEFKELTVIAKAKNDVYVSDGKEATLLYGSANTLNVGDKISGKVKGDLVSYFGLTEMKNVDYTGVTVASKGNAVSPIVVTLEELAAKGSFEKYESQLVIVKGVKVGAAKFSNKNIDMVDGATKVTLRDNYSAATNFEFDTNASYDFTGVIGQFKGKSQINLLSKEGIQISTGIEAVETENGAQVIYDLSGRRVAKAVKGLYIINGKKVYVK